MKKTRYLAILTFLLLPFLSTAQPSDTLSACLDSAISHAKTFSLYRSTVNWDTIQKGMHWRAGLAKNVLDLRPAFQYMLDELHDTHARFFVQGKPVAWYSGEPSPYQKTIDPKVWTALQSGKQKFQYGMLPGETGYLRLVGIPMGDNAQLAAPIQAAVCTLIAQGARQWVVDLRYNGGGNMFAMLAGVATLLGNADVGGSQDGDGNRYSTWTIKAGDVYLNKYLGANTEDRCPLENAPKVAVLTSRYTVSSAEAVAVAFKGRPNTRFFGEPTGGFTSETDWKQLPAGAIMSIGVGRFVDREGRVYKENIPVDVEAPFVPDAPGEQDAGVLKALEWLMK